MTFNKETNLYFNIHLNEISELTENSKLVYSALYTSAYITNQTISSKGGRNLTSFTFSQKQLSEVLKMSNKTVYSSIKQLSELNLISTYLSDDKMESYYKIYSPVDKTEITDFSKYSAEFNEAKDGYSYNPMIIIPAEIIQLNEVASIRLAIAELQFVWMRKEDRSEQYYNLCNLTTAEKILHKNFRHTLETLKEKGYINYEVSSSNKFKGFTNIQFNLNPAKEIETAINEAEETIEVAKEIVKEAKTNETNKETVQKTETELLKEEIEQLKEQIKQQNTITNETNEETETNEIDENKILNFLNGEEEETETTQPNKNYIIPFPKQYIANEEYFKQNDDKQNDDEDFSLSDLFNSNQSSKPKLTEKDYEEMMNWAI